MTDDRAPASDLDWSELSEDKRGFMIRCRNAWGLDGSVSVPPDMRDAVTWLDDEGLIWCRHGQDEGAPYPVRAVITRAGLDFTPEREPADDVADDDSEGAEVLDLLREIRDQLLVQTELIRGLVTVAP